ncbi:unnamed protein product [Sphagnum jensenii]|uniref:Uncharacterized protein n=1 Tax=Sphagnum jensenii TaxID=128206 RepID=A0ABP1A2E3_9BRYO
MGESQPSVAIFGLIATVVVERWEVYRYGKDGVAYASASSAVGKQRRPAPRRGQVKAAIAASWLNALTSIVYGARSVALSRSHSRWSFRSS